ncbi:MAG: hypothetical protein HQK61_07225 [Desulfamplus sp.]|nr:hypothetical protein [Desulfamplus sp.]
MTVTAKKFIECRQCGERMDILTVKKYNGSWPGIFMASGAVCILFIGGPVLGVPLLLLGVYQYTAKQTISYCPSCGYHYRIFVSDEK